MTVVGIIAALAAAYLIGSVSGARVLAGAFAAPDIRTLGSGNAGTSNAWRIGGRGYGAAGVLRAHASRPGGAGRAHST